MSDGATLTFTDGAEYPVLEAFGWELTDEGYIWDGDAVKSVAGYPVHIDDFAGVVEYKGDPTPIRDDFGELLTYIEYRHEKGGGEP